MKQNFAQNFLFDNHFRYRFARHFLFWLVLFIYFTIQGIQDDKLVLNLKLNLLFLPLDMVTTYFLIYVIFPKALHKSQLISALSLFIFVLIFQFSVSNLIHTYIRPFIDPENTRMPFLDQLFNDIHILFMIYGSALFIKTIKYLYYVQVGFNEITKKNIEQKMSLLTSQLHPHFLFNTFNNLYALSVEKSDLVPQIIMKLSDVIRYMLYDYEMQYVKLSKELEIVKSYIEIEKLRYDRHLAIDIQVEIPENKIIEIDIPPLLLFTFVENAFKHGLSQTPDGVFIKIKIKTVSNFLLINVENSTDEFSIKDNQREKIGIENIKKRLELYYPNKYSFLMNREKDRFVINLEINMENYEN